MNYLGPTRTRLIQVMSSTAWGLVIILFVSTVFGSVRMYVLISVGCVVMCLSVSEAYKRKVTVSSSKTNDTTLAEKSESPVVSQSDDEVDTFSEVIAESNVPMSSTPSKRSDTQMFHPADISSTHPAVIQSGLIHGHNAEFKHTDSVECIQSTDVCTSITTRHNSALLDDSHVIHDTTSNNQGINDIGSHDQRESHEQRGSHDYTDFGIQVDKKLRKTSFRTSNKRQLITHIFFILILICVVTLFYHNPWLACSLLLPVACMVLIRRIAYISFVNAQLKWAWLRWKSSSLYNTIFPPLVRHVYNAYAKLDKKVIVFVVFVACGKLFIYIPYSAKFDGGKF